MPPGDKQPAAEKLLGRATGLFHVASGKTLAGATQVAGDGRVDETPRVNDEKADGAVEHSADDNVDVVADATDGDRFSASFDVLKDGCDCRMGRPERLKKGRGPTGGFLDASDARRVRCAASSKPLQSLQSSRWACGSGSASLVLALRARGGCATAAV